MVGTYTPPHTSEEAYFCQFWNIEPYAFGAMPKVICSHIHIKRELAEKAYQQRFTRDMQGQKFVLCVKPYIYDEDRGGLELTFELEGWIEPIFPLNWYSSPLRALARIPEDKVLDLRFVPTKDHYFEAILSRQTVQKRAKLLAPEPERKVSKKPKHHPYEPQPSASFKPEEGRPTIKQMEQEITGMNVLSQRKRGTMILASEGIAWNSALSRLDWLLKKLEPWTWTEWEIVHLLKRIDVTPEKFAKLKKKSVHVWYEEKYGPSWLL